jgi:hypothetical protein
MCTLFYKVVADSCYLQISSKFHNPSSSAFIRDQNRSRILCPPKSCRFNCIAYFSGKALVPLRIDDFYLDTNFSSQISLKLNAVSDGRPMKLLHSFFIDQKS